MEKKTYENALAMAFPAVDAGIQPFGSRVLVQIRTPKTITKGGIILTLSDIDTEFYSESFYLFHLLKYNVRDLALVS